ncbi:TetR/AcrR family transcriptional regulator [Paenibacillus radicis (ex Gao et al. 2016)]|uniref:TetR family transcriptional regulator n=1 Tax=Paenibacillus radicis (ex Gao et al. 2016) TaxID=1737354 RepID=A0A917GXC4_9BACL|nr:TetR/AcrR family transcriptional regulator [Paenibacillus radicis (ex Gao et al. 2016)]GGG59783.1 TetR family transcriptional regulator [Paenibacillus radicis (ex Gao et al. 2016)]
MRVVKEPEERKSEILDVAEELFFTKGYARTTVNDILQAIGIAKGTFYYYFKSKEEVMDAVVTRYIDTGVAAGKQIAADEKLSVHEKLLQIIMAQKQDTDKKVQLIEQFHQPENAVIHQKSLTETILKLTPVLTEVVEQGIQEKLFHTPYPKETMEFLLISSQFMFDEGIFKWEPEEIAYKIQAFIHVMEVSLGAEQGSFAYVVKMFEQLSKE